MMLWVQIRVMFLSMFAITEASKLYGSEGCPCVGIDVSGSMKPFPTVAIDDSKSGTWDTFPPEIGTTCSSWDENANSLCKGPNPPEFCSQRWCYVDPCNCKGIDTAPKQTQNIAGSNIKGRPMYFSFSTCGDQYLLDDGWPEQSCWTQKSPSDCTTHLTSEGSKCGWLEETGCVDDHLLSMCSITEPMLLEMQSLEDVVTKTELNMEPNAAYGIHSWLIIMNCVTLFIVFYGVWYFFNFCEPRSMKPAGYDVLPDAEEPKVLIHQMQSALNVVREIKASSSAERDCKHDSEYSWGYDSHNGPDTWCAHYEAANGKIQSPIDVNLLNVKDVKGLPHVTHHYKNCKAVCVNNSHTVCWTVEDGGHILIDEKRFDLVQFHYHCPSEHYINGEQFPLCLHFVHVSEDGTLAVLGRVFKFGATSNNFIDAITQSKPLKAHEKFKVDEIPFQHLNATGDYVHYPGSLTTPPCSEGVLWHVKETLDEISHAQENWFRSCLSFDNARPLQDLNDRDLVRVRIGSRIKKW